MADTGFAAIRAASFIFNLISVLISISVFGAKHSMFTFPLSVLKLRNNMSSCVIFSSQYIADKVTSRERQFGCSTFSYFCILIFLQILASVVECSPFLSECLETAE
ncbi:hypothetical protein KP509_04G089100 [Ceratopteris richardii]|uniref:Uncharacterized protein n=1 Tax=Ceratopteris richardii TaxID=49495 RepID=A0A8T2V715_CERRI|nr:hypothetical protein KP509_04G089100 [Ceratopteris richardii]